MKEKYVSEQEAVVIGNNIGVDWDEVSLSEFRRGLEVEQEHGSLWGDITDVTKDDPLLTGRIALAHLKEIPDYYTRLDRMEAEAESKKS